MAEKDVAGVSIMTIGGEANKTNRWENSSLSLSGGYTTLKGYDKVFNSTIDWQKPVESFNGTAVYRLKTKNNGLLKAYATADFGDLAYHVPLSNKQIMLISNKGKTGYSNVSFRNALSEKSMVKMGVSSTLQNNKLGLGENSLQTNEVNVESKINFIHDVSEGIKLSWGANETFNRYHEIYDDNTADFELNFTDHLVGAFVESEIKFTKNLAIRPGIRSEYSSAIQKFNFAPRFALAVKTGEKAQISGAWGLYHQTPQADYLKLTTHLDFEKAMHYILSYQFGSVSERLFRAEAYYKTYHNLITWELGEYGLPTQIKNNGFGYAGGLDIFWRDKKSIKGFDYWITYSYIDTQRKYKNYPEQATPYFISNHNFSVVGKYWLNKINTQVGVSYTAASGRPYNIYGAEKFNSGKTKMYSDLSLNFSHIFYIGNQYSILYCSVNNVLGHDNVLSYRPSNIADAQGNYTMIPIKRDLKRMVFMGLFLNF